jgi:hypothetical protein
MVTEIELFESSDLTPLDFCLLRWMKSEVYKINLDTKGKLFSRILHPVACIKKSED